MKALRLALVVLLGNGGLLSLAAESAPASVPPERHLLIPVLPMPQTWTDAMTARVANFRQERTFLQLADWEPVAALPDWVFEPAQREIAFLPPRFYPQHDFRYAIIAGQNGELLIVRAGGSDGRQEIFRAKPAPVPAPTTKSEVKAAS